MNVQKASETEAETVTPGRRRRVIHTEHLMVVVWEFTDGPWTQFEPPHAHPHEQIAYVLEGEIIFFLGEDAQRLQTGDMVAVPPHVPHGIRLLSPSARLLDSFTPLRQEFL